MSEIVSLWWMFFWSLLACGLDATIEIGVNNTAVILQQKAGVDRYCKHLIAIRFQYISLTISYKSTRHINLVRAGL